MAISINDYLKQNEAILEHPRPNWKEKQFWLDHGEEKWYQNWRLDVGDWKMESEVGCWRLDALISNFQLRYLTSYL